MTVDPSNDPTPGVPGHASPRQVTVGWSPKALWGALVAVLAPAALNALALIVEVLAGNPALLDGLPTPVVVFINIIVSGIGALLAARAASPGRVITK